MIKVEIKTSEDEQSFIVNITGHADYADCGQDIICASASMLLYELAQCVKDMEGAEKLRKKAVIRIEDGDASIVFKPKVAFYTEAFIRLSTVQRGFDLLVHNFPDYVSYV